MCILVRRKKKVQFDMLVGLTAGPEAKAADISLDNQSRRKKEDSFVCSTKYVDVELYFNVKVMKGGGI